MNRQLVAGAPTPRAAMWRRHSRGVRGVSLALAGALSAASLVALSTGAANAAPPEFPDNIVVFPDRDFVTVEGYQDHIGETAIVEVTRPGVGVIGSAQSVVAEGDVAFEINHPGGVCWGKGTGVNVTPDIQGGDIVAVKFAGKSAGDTTVADAAVTSVQYTPGSTELKVTGRLGASVNTSQLEQRVVNPGLKDTAVARRDIRAVPGPMIAAAKGGYSSGLEISGQTFTATYEFLDPDVAAAAAVGGGERIMAWQNQDADANRQGLTISEFGELGGPGMGGCPNGPLGSGPAGPTNVTAAKIAGGYKVAWTPAVAVPGTPAITGYQVSAVGQTVTANERPVIGKRISGQAAKTTSLTGLSSSETYDIEIVSVSSVGLTFPAVNANSETDSTPPTVTASPAAGTYPVAQTVSLTSSEPNTDIYYTTDPDLNLSDGDAPSANATHYNGPIAITESSTLRWLALDPTGNFSNDSAEYTITNAPTPAAPVLGTPTLGNRTVTLDWTLNDPSVTGYFVQAYDAAGAPFENLQEVLAPPVTISNLEPGEEYTVQVTAKNANGTGETATTKVFTAQGTLVANAGADQSVRRNTKVTLDGGGSTSDLTYKWEQVLTGATDPDKVTLTNATSKTASFTYPLFKHPMTNNQLTFKLTVSDGTNSKTDEVKVSAIPDRVTIALAKWKSGDFRVEGSNSTIGATITIRSANNPNVILGTAPVTAAAAPATGGTWSLRVRTGTAANTNPGRIFADSSFGGTAGPTTVTNG